MSDRALDLAGSKAAGAHMHSLLRAVYGNIDTLCHALPFEETKKTFLAVHCRHTDDTEALVGNIAGVLRDHFRIRAYISHMSI